MPGKKRASFITVPTKNDLILDAVAFTATLIAAIWQGWLAHDVIWAAWLASLLIGLSFFLVMAIKLTADAAKGALQKDDSSGSGCLAVAVIVPMAGMAWLVGPGMGRAICLFLIGIELSGILAGTLAHKKWLGVDPDRPLVRALAYMPQALFVFCFFLVHFGMFHLGHAVFLSFIAPLQLEYAAPMDSIADFFQTIKNFFGALIHAYWPYVLSVAVMSFSMYKNALMKTDKKTFMFLPYKNVIRIHLLIFVLFPLAALDLGRTVMIVALFFFFFPVEGFATWYRQRR